MKLAIGTVQFGLPYGIINHSGQVSFEQASEVLSMGRVHGIKYLDTAIAYGNSEARLGKIGVSGFQVVTKLPPLPDLLPDGVADAGTWAKAHLTASLQRLRLDSIYGLLLHKSTDLLGPFGPTLLKALKEFRDQGLVKKIGVSVYAPKELEAVLSLTKLDLVQAPLNLVDRRLETSGWLRRLKDLDVEVHTRSAFLQGLLLTRAEALPPKFLPWLALWQRWQTWQTASACSALGACLAFPQSFPEVDRVVTGVDGPAHLQGILAAMREPLPPYWPEIACDDDQLVNPSRWSEL